MRIFLLFLLYLTSFSSAQTYGTVSVTFILTNEGRPVTNTSTVTLSTGEKITFEHFKFFISDVAVSQNTGRETRASEPQIALADLGKKAGNFKDTVKYRIAAGEYSDLRFNVAVPREQNHSDPTSAPPPLDIGKGDMFWSWNSGYIFLLAEGTCLNCPQKKFHFAIGGDQNVMPLAFGSMFDPTPVLKVKSGQVTNIVIEIDVALLFTNADGTQYKLENEDKAIVHSGTNAALLRNNLLKAFRLKSVVFAD